MRTVLFTLALASTTLTGCSKPAPLPEPGSNQVAQLSPVCTLVKTLGETQTFSCPPNARVELRSFGNDEISGPPCFIDNVEKATVSSLYQVICPTGQRYDPKMGHQWLGLFYRG